MLAAVEVVSVRDADSDHDEASIPEVLAPLAADYPDFNGWLTRSLSAAIDHSDRSARLRSYSMSSGGALKFKTYVELEVVPAPESALVFDMRPPQEGS